MHAALDGPGARRTWPRIIAIAAAVLALGIGSADAGTTPRRELVVCADPVGMPFSNDRLEGFENRIAGLVAGALDLPVRYHWNVTWRRGFLRSLRDGTCDVVIGVPAGLPGITITRPYYTSTYVFVSPRNTAPPLSSFDDPRLRHLRIGLHAVGAERANAPPASALARRGLGGNVVGYAQWGDDSQGAPQGAIVDALLAGEIDTAIVWGPLGGYFAKPHADRLVATPVSDIAPEAAAPFAYAMSIGVREGDEALRADLDRVLDALRPEIGQVLQAFGVPRVDTTPGTATRTSRTDPATNRSNEPQEH